MIRNVWTISLYLMILLLAPISHAAQMFTIDLRLGMSHTQVKLLQQLLNANPDTLLTSSGAGSKGQETDYFGALTLAAIIKFQEKYRSEILVPAGLASGSGFVGPLTRAVLNRLLAPPPVSTAPQAPASSPPSNTYINLATSGDYFSTSSLETLAPYLPASFNPSLISTTTQARYDAYEDLSGAILSFMRAKLGSEFPIPTYSTSTIAGSSTAALPAFKAGAIAPKISIGQKNVDLSEALLISGTNLSMANGVYTSLGQIRDVALTGTSTLSVRLIDMPGFSFYTQDYVPSIATTSLYVWVVNENGVSNVVGPIMLSFR